MTPDAIVQFVCFETSLPRLAFVRRWEPFVTSFLARGIERVVLSERIDEGDFGFVSRNLWPAARFREVFAGGLPRPAGGGGVVAVQAGGFVVVDRAGPTHPGDGAHILLLLRCTTEPLSAVVPALSGWARRHDQGFGWTAYAADPATRGGRCDVALELGCRPESAARVRALLIASQPASLVLASSAQTQRDFLTLP